LLLLHWAKLLATLTNKFTQRLAFGTVI